MKQNPTTYVSAAHLLLHRALTGDVQMQAVFENVDPYKYGKPEVTSPGEYDEEGALHDRDRAADMNEIRRL